MKKIFYSILAASTLFTLSSCLEETFPESDTITAEQIAEVASGMESAVAGISARMQQGYLVYGEQVHETDMAYPQLMIAQTEMLGDMYPEGEESGYDWYRNYNCCNRTFGPSSYFAYLPYRTLYMFVKDANSVISLVDIEDPNVSEQIRAYAGIAYACRAFDYYMLTVLYEPRENIYTDVSNVLGLTVPIVTEKTTEAEAIDNPRATHEEMMEFILSDLEKAERCLKDVDPSSLNRMAPTLATVYGLFAKAYRWDDQFDKAAEYARKAIDQAQAEYGAEPVSEAQIDDPGSGFNTANQAWMWYIHYDAENMGNLCNFTGWMSAEAEWGYSPLTLPCMDRSLYEKMGKKDIRRRLFLDPQRNKFYNYRTCRDADFIADAPDYLALKFRCLGGDHTSYQTGGAVDVPVMRIEEMYLIEAEAVGVSQGIGAGVDLLNKFMQTYRDADYSCKATQDLRGFQIEVLTQMRLEFWGEGNAFPTAKRLAPDVIQNYEGTNAPSDIFKINVKGIKPWWTLVIPDSEESANKAIPGHNNPDPSGTVVAPIAIGEFAPANF